MTAFKVDIKKDDIQRLTGTGWLNDEIVNTYLNMIVLRNVSQPERYPKVHMLSSFVLSPP